MFSIRDKNTEVPQFFLNKLQAHIIFPYQTFTIYIKFLLTKPPKLLAVKVPALFNMSRTITRHLCSEAEYFPTSSPLVSNKH